MDLDLWHAGPPTGRADGALACPTCATALLADIDDRPQVSRPEDAADLLAPAVAGRDREHCVAGLLDTKHRLVRLETVSIGSVDHTFMAPREVFRSALLGGAAALVLAHNHPRGDPEPSRDDLLVTRRLAEAGRLLGVTLLDHLVVGGARWVSLARRGEV